MNRKRKKTNSAATFIMLAALFVMICSLTIMFRNALSVCFEPDDYDTYIKDAAVKYGVDPNLIRAVIYTETKFDASAVGAAGEIGLMQILPSGAAADYARLNKLPTVTRLQLFNPKLNIEIGAWFLAQGIQRYSGRSDVVSLAICRYNAGESRARKWAAAEEGEVAEKIDIASTRAYLEKVLSRMTLYNEQESEK